MMMHRPTPLLFYVYMAALISCAPINAAPNITQEHAANGTDSGKTLTQQPRIYSNMEEVYFDAEAKKNPAPWLSIRAAISPTNEKFEFIDAFGNIIAPPENVDILGVNDDEITLQIGGEENGEAGRTTTLIRANPVSCWSAVKKATPVSEDAQASISSNDDWIFAANLKLHDQGGRTKLGGGDSGAPETILRVRRVMWPVGSSNKPSLVLYVFTSDNPQSAVSYSWADIDAKRIGINLRWMQASCTVEPAE
ncbi:hypothetical protein LPB140_00930 [Sphingorhabdus lutea]|uniref:Uncharacterized protein n=1 Tax=Sphingorhabdus lutea TaxID=1913578 RepID=A0A1L3J935_9SPHN|nr:hypothetical protein [Sphingorhabdus lutea]APG61637.1 hypothetical protein LPB140_00930 [Sphingorhabdus lutea]